jgi:hypothetical protein
MSTKHELEQAAKDNHLVRLYRENLEEGFADGYIVGAGPDFFAMEVVDSTIRFDGYNCMRYVDVSQYEIPHPHVGFVERALELRSERRRKNSGIDLSSVSALLRTAGAAFPLVAIHMEIEDPDTCAIGRVCSVSESEVELETITPDAEWDEEIEKFSVSEITRVDFGCAYEEALLLVAGAG